MNPVDYDWVHCEVQEMTSIIKEINNSGISIIVIEHIMEAVISLSLAHETSKLESLIKNITRSGASVLTINQNLSLGGQAHIVFSIDITNMNKSVEDLILEISKETGTSNAN